MLYSIIIPVYNRPDEVDALLRTLSQQEYSDFEVIIIEDGSSNPCDAIVSHYSDILKIKYISKENGGPSKARNVGVQSAQGEYVIFLDSDCEVPSGYLQEVSGELEEKQADAFGGPDKAGSEFTPLQKAISYTMTSFFTTGGIRGGKKKLDKFYPRSFNMGIKKTLYDKLGGFSEDMRFGEDIDLSLRIFESGSSCRLFPKAWVWHKRRTDFRKFFRQVINSGIARIHLTKRHPGSLKIVHLLPAVFAVATTMMLILGVFLTPWLFAPLVLYSLLLFIDATRLEKNMYVGLLAIPSAFVQLGGYGLGFIWAWWKCNILHQGEFGAFKNNFYK